MTARDRLEQLVGPMLAGAIVDAVREELELGEERSSSEPCTAVQSREWLSREEAAGHLGVSVATVDRYIRAGRLRSSTIGRRRLVARETLEGAK